MNQIPIRFLSSLAIYALGALIVSAIFHSDMLHRMTINTPEKIGMPLLGPRTDLGDNYHYYAYAKGGLSACTTGLGEGSAEKGNAIACTFTGALLVSHGLYSIASALAPSVRYEAAFTLILHTALLAFGLIVCLTTVLQMRLRLGAAISGSGVLLFLLGNFALSFYLGFPYKYFGNLYAGEPDVMRILNPTTFWALGLLSLAALVNAIRNPSRASLLGCIFLALILGSASIAVAGTLLAGLALYLLVELTMTRRLCKPALVCAVALFLGVVSTLWAFKVYWASEMGRAFNHGQFLAITAKMSFLFLILPIAIGRIAPDGGKVDRLMKSVLFAAMGVGMFCDSVEFGGRLWLRGAVIFALFCCAAWVWSSLPVLVSYLSRRSNRANLASRSSKGAAMGFGATVVASTFLFAALLICRPWNPDTWRGYMERDKYEVLTWINQHAREGDVIASSNLDDSYVIPFYTRASVLAPVFGLTALSPTESVKRHFHVLSLLQNGKDRMASILETENSAIDTHFRFLVSDVKEPYDYAAFQKVAFYESLIYYPYNHNYKDVLTDPQSRQQFTARMRELETAGTQHDYRFTYLVLRIDELLTDRTRFKEVFRNKSFTVLQPAVPRS